jgi:hypothetical protein
MQVLSINAVVLCLFRYVETQVCAGPRTKPVKPLKPLNGPGKAMQQLHAPFYTPIMCA